MHAAKVGIAVFVSEIILTPSLLCHLKTISKSVKF